LSDLREELIDLIAAEALIDKAKLIPTATLADVGLDSVGVVSLVFAVEEKFDVEVAEDAFTDVSDLGDFLTRLETIINAKRAA
jgi:acyl carrier protein